MLVHAVHIVKEEEIEMLIIDGLSKEKTSNIAEISFTSLIW